MRGVPPRYIRLRARHLAKWLRRKARHAFGTSMARFCGRRAHQSFIDPRSLTSVLVCRVNGRIGNTVFLVPALRLLHEQVPHAQIDLLVGNAAAGELLSRLPGVRRVLVFPRKTWALWRYLRAVHEVRAFRYDLAVDPTPDSFSGRMAVTLCRAKHRLGFDTPSQWAALTHATPLPSDISTVHEAHRPALLLAQVFRVAWRPAEARLSLPLPEDKVAEARRIIAQACGPDRRAIGFFAHATDFKRVDPPWWMAFWETFLSLVPMAVPIEFLPSFHHAPLNSRFKSVHLPSLTTLTAAFGETRMFISADGGPMHLASATAVPTVALFRGASSVVYGPLKPEDLSIDVTQCSPQQVAYKCRQIWFRCATPASDTPVTLERQDRALPVN